LVQEEKKENIYINLLGTSNFKKKGGYPYPRATAITSTTETDCLRFLATMEKAMSLRHGQQLVSP
jgi:hypothetical protein